MKVKNILALITNILLIALGAIPVVLTIIEQPTFDYLTLGTHLPYVVFCLLVLVSLWRLNIILSFRWMLTICLYGGRSI